MHFNEKVNRPAALTKSGVKRHKVTFPKFKKGESSVREVKVAASYNYVNDLIGEIVYRCKANSEKTILEERLPPAPPSVKPVVMLNWTKLCW